MSGEAELGGEIDPVLLAHELRNTLAAVDMLLEHAEDQIEAGESPLTAIAKARAGVAETIAIVAERIERSAR